MFPKDERLPLTDSYQHHNGHLPFSFSMFNFLSQLLRADVDFVLCSALLDWYDESE